MLFVNFLEYRRNRSHFHGVNDSLGGNNHFRRLLEHFRQYGLCDFGGQAAQVFEEFYQLSFHALRQLRSVPVLAFHEGVLRIGGCGPLHGI